MVFFLLWDVPFLSNLSPERILALCSFKNALFIFIVKNLLVYNCLHDILLVGRFILVDLL